MADNEEFVGYDQKPGLVEVGDTYGSKSDLSAYNSPPPAVTAAASGDHGSTQEEWRVPAAESAYTTGPPPYQPPPSSLVTGRRQRGQDDVEHLIDPTGYGYIGGGRGSAGGSFQQQQQQQQQQLQTSVIVMGHPGYQQQQMSAGSGTPNYDGLVSLACVVTWCCCLFIGLFAYILADTAKKEASRGKHQLAKQYGWASFGVSIAGIVVGIAVTAIIVAWRLHKI